MPNTTPIDFGNLAGLIGTWTGSNGVNLIAVPDQKGDFTLLIAPYSETLTVNAVPATTPDRGLQTIQQIPTLSYNTTINNAQDQSLMHVENGFWELMDSVVNNGFDIFRLATIPHGNSLLAMGNSSVIAGPPAIDTTLNAEPLGDLPALNGYTDAYIGPPALPGFLPTSPNQYLVDYLNKQLASGLTVSSTTVLQISTQNQGGVNNIPFLGSNVNATQFDATFWLETLVDAKGNTTQQLQYSQRILLQFPIRSNMSGQTITWPHINVNTLTLSA